ELLRKSPEDRVATAVVLSNRLKAMEFGLAQRDGEPGESLEFDDRPPRNKPVQATDAETAIRPTIELDNRPPGTEATPSAGNESLGDETIITEGNAIEPDTDDTISPSAPRTHYVTVEESSGSTIRLPTEVAEQPRGNSLWTTIALASALVALLAALIYSTWPESADDLYSRIIIVAAASPTSELLNVRGDMEHFVERFPDDHRSQEIKLYLRDHDGYRLWRRLERESRKIGGVDFLPVVERGFVAAFRDLQQEPDVARYKFEKLLESHADTTLETEDAQRCLDSAAHWLNRIPAPPQPTGS
ncbi:MAG: hypothetical protein QF805_03465, partial [Pirellulaceae bacterium]|nr:hypothetical protein [Pirellulaceae bacterium]